MKRLIAIIFILTASISYAKTGNTLEQSMNQYGEPIGTAGNQQKKIQIYNTPTAKITETYNANGICISSVVKYKTQPIRRNYKPKPILKPHYTVGKKIPGPAPIIKRTTPPSPLARPTPRQTAFSTNMKNTTPFAFGLIILSSIIGLTIALIKKKPIPANEDATTDQKIESLCGFTQRKHDNKAKQHQTR